MNKWEKLKEQIKYNYDKKAVEQFLKLMEDLEDCKEEEVNLTPLEKLRKENIELFAHHVQGISFMLKQSFDAGVKFGEESMRIKEKGFLAPSELGKWVVKEKK